MAKINGTEAGKKYRQNIVELVKVMGQAVQDRAEDIVGESDGYCDLVVRIVFRQNEVPTLEVERTHIVKECIDAMVRSAR